MYPVGSSDDRVLSSSTNLAPLITATVCESLVKTMHGHTMSCVPWKEEILALGFSIPPMAGWEAYVLVMTSLRTI